jgi:hypothetical protein
LWTEKEAADWAASAPEYRIVWDESGRVTGLHEQTPGKRYWDVTVRPSTPFSRVDA